MSISLAQSKMATFFRNLSILTLSHDLCTIILNGAVSSRVYTSEAAAASSESFGKAQQDTSLSSSSSVTAAALASSYSSSSPSIFPSIQLKPALGKSFPFYVDLHLFVNRILREEVAQMIDASATASNSSNSKARTETAVERVEKTLEVQAEVIACENDKEVAVEQQQQQQRQQRQQHVNVLEVLADRYGPRVGRWAAFTVVDGVRLCDA